MHTYTSINAYYTHTQIHIHIENIVLTKTGT